MSQRTRKPTRARVAAALTASMLAAPVLSLGLLAPSASAATMAVQKADTLLEICEHKEIYPEDGPGLYCDANDIAGLLSGALDPIFNTTCLNAETNVVICRVDKDLPPDNNWAPGGVPRDQT